MSEADRRNVGTTHRCRPLFENPPRVVPAPAFNPLGLVVENIGIGQNVVPDTGDSLYRMITY